MCIEGWFSRDFFFLFLYRRLRRQRSLASTRASTCESLPWSFALARCTRRREYYVMREAPNYLRLYIYICNTATLTRGSVHISICISYVCIGAPRKSWWRNSSFFSLFVKITEGKIDNDVYIRLDDSMARWFSRIYMYIASFGANRARVVYIQRIFSMCVYCHAKVPGWKVLLLYRRIWQDLSIIYQIEIS